MRTHSFAGMDRISTDIEGWELREVFSESLEYQELLRLRFNELRKPLGLEWTEAEGEADKLDRHFGLYHEEAAAKHGAEPGRAGDEPGDNLRGGRGATGAPGLEPSSWRG